MIHASALLFDMDGTLLSSIEATERVWGAWAAQHPLNIDEFLRTIHGKRAIDTIANLSLPGMDAKVEAAKITAAEIKDLEDVREIPGAVHFLKSLVQDRWAIVTSAPKALAAARLNAAEIPIPRIMITSEDVKAGKPDPEGYLLAAQRLGIPIKNCLVFEDATAGILAGEAAGARVCVVTAMQTKKIKTGHPSFLDYRQLKVEIGVDCDYQISFV